MCDDRTDTAAAGPQRAGHDTTTAHHLLSCLLVSLITMLRDDAIESACKQVLNCYNIEMRSFGSRRRQAAHAAGRRFGARAQLLEICSE